MKAPAPLMPAPPVKRAAPDGVSAMSNRALTV